MKTIAAMICITVLLCMCLYCEQISLVETNRASVADEATIPWTENLYYEGMVQPDPNYIPSVRDDPEIRDAIRKHQIRLRDMGFYKGYIDGRVGEKTRDAYDNYVIWFMGRDTK